MAKKETFSGCYTALATPFKGASIDHGAFERFVDWQVREGVHGLVPCGTTGESPTLSHEEHKDLITRTVKLAKGRAKVMAGTGSNSTTTAIEFTRHAEKAGADAALIVAPYYNKPTQEGLFQHYSTLARKSGLPIFVYNVPGRSGINVADETLARLAEACPTIVGVKDATGDLARVASLRALVGDRLLLLSGEDTTAVGFNAMGGRGVISVISNLAPKAMARVQELTFASKYDEARTLLEKYTTLIDLLFAETNPMPVKYALSLMGKCRADTRLPMIKPSSGLQKQLKRALSGLKLI